MSQSEPGTISRKVSGGSHIGVPVIENKSWEQIKAKITLCVHPPPPLLQGNVCSVGHGPAVFKACVKRTLPNFTTYMLWEYIGKSWLSIFTSPALAPPCSLFQPRHNELQRVHVNSVCVVIHSVKLYIGVTWTNVCSDWGTRPPGDSYGGSTWLHNLYIEFI